MADWNIFWNNIEQVMKDILDEKHWDREENGQYFSTICADYCDEISDYTLKDLMEHDNPNVALMDTFLESADEYAWERCSEFKKEIFDALPQELYNHFEDDITEWLESHVHFETDLKHYNRDVYLTLTIDAGDANYDYTCNNILNYASDGSGKFPKESSILWLAKQQGKEELLKKTVKDYLSRNIKPDDRFTSSVITEMINLPSSMGALTFLVKMPLLDYFNLIDDIRARKDGILIVPKEATCGLYNKWDGGGSVLEIELDKGVEIPFSMIGDIAPDINNCYGVHGCLPWSVHNVYGVNDSLWKAELSTRVEDKEQEEEAER